MKNNSCLLDRLYSTKCNYMQIHLTLRDFLRISCTKKWKKGKKNAAIKRSCTYLCMKIENIKARCAPIVYIMLQRTCKYKKTYEKWPDNTLPGTQRYRCWAGNRTHAGPHMDSLHASLQPDPTGSTSTTAGSTSDYKQTRSFSLEFWC